MKPGDVSRAHGAFNMISGAWPLVSMTTFEAVLGPKTDRWLVRTVGGLLLTVGLVEATASEEPAAVGQARRVGLAVSMTLAASDIWYASRGRISRMYLADAAVQISWIAALARARP
jgi:hypothetical protein